MNPSRCAPLAFLLFFHVGAAGAQITFSAPQLLSAGTSPAAVASADFTGDTHLDLITVNRASDDAHVYVGDGQGGFTFLQSFAVGNFPQGVIAARFNVGAEWDVANTSVPFNTGNVTAWLGAGDGSFASSDVLVTDDGPRGLVAVDLDEDGALDLAAVNSTRGNLSTFLGDGDGTFGTEIRTPVGSASSFPTDLAVADFNEDGDLDVITSNAQSVDDSLGIVFGDGDGTFGGATAIPTTCDRPESVVAGDFDGDEHTDVAVACFVSGEVAVLLGNGAGGFGSPTLLSLAPESGSYWVLSGDFDNDGELDLATSNNGSFSVLRGKGDGSSEPPIHRTAVGEFFGADAADYDGDGRLDLAFANFGQDEVWVYSNTTPPRVPSLQPLVALALSGTLAAFGFTRAGRA